MPRQVVLVVLPLELERDPAEVAGHRAVERQAGLAAIGLADELARALEVDAEPAREPRRVDGPAVHEPRVAPLRLRRAARLRLEPADHVHADVDAVGEAVLGAAAADEVVRIVDVAAGGLVDVLDVRHARDRGHRERALVVDEAAAAERGVDAELVELADREHQAAAERDVEVAERALEVPARVLERHLLAPERLLAEAAAQGERGRRVGAARAVGAIHVQRGVEARPQPEPAPREIDVQTVEQVREAQLLGRGAGLGRLHLQRGAEIAVVRDEHRLDDAEREALLEQREADRARGGGQPEQKRDDEERATADHFPRSAATSASTSFSSPAL